MLHPCNQTQYGGGIVSVSYLDDGWGYIRLNFMVTWLRSLDEKIAKTGGYRNRTQTKVIVYTSADDLQNNWSSWRMDELEQFATICSKNTIVLSLGGMLGADALVNELFVEKTKTARLAHERLADAGDSQVEHVIARTCLSACKATHLL